MSEFSLPTGCILPNKLKTKNMRHQFEPGSHYHEVLKANGDTFLFKDRQDWRIFQKSLRRFILPCCEIVSYSLLGNHCHLLLKPHPEEVLNRLSLQLEFLGFILEAENLPLYLSGDIPVHFPSWAPLYKGDVQTQISHCLRSVKISYGLYYKHKYDFRGALWGRDKSSSILPFPEDIKRTMIYIHNNAVYHGLAKNTEDWEYSSFQEILAGYSQLVDINKALEIFENKEIFLNEHALMPEDYGRKSKMAR